MPLRNLMTVRNRRRGELRSARLRLFRFEDRLAPSSSIPLNSTTWTPLGPAPINSGTAPGGISSSGRVAALAAHPTDANILYVGAASGGVWKTTNATATNPSWTPLTDAQAALTTGDIALAPSNPNIIYVGTGEPHNSGDSFYGRGVLKSADAGTTWTLLNNGGVFDRRVISRVAVDPTDPNIVYVTVFGGGVNALGGNTGLYRSTNGGTTWTNLSASLGTSTIFSDFELDPADRTVGYLGAGNSGGSAANGVYKVTNLLGSASFSLITALPNGTAGGGGRVQLAISRNTSTSQTVVYAGFHNASTGALLSLWQSTDSGTTWVQRTATPTNSLGSQGWYDFSLLADPNDATGNTVILGGAATSNRLIRSTNGGVSWTSLIPSSGAAPHVDHHALAIDANGRIIDGDDGGVYRLNNLSPLSWQSLNGVATTPNVTALNTNQFVGIAIHPTNSNLALGGTQDNGTQRFNDSVGWSTVDGGDGGEVVYDPFNPNTLYRISPVGSFGTSAFVRRSTNGGVSWSNITSGIVNPNSAQFYPPLIVDPSTQNRVLMGTNVVNVTTNSGTSWSQLGAAPPSTSSIRSLGIGPASSSTLYVGSNSSNVFVTTDNGATWNTRTPSGGNAFNDFAVDPTNSNIAYVVSASFTGSVRVWRTTNAGATWTSIMGDLPNVPAWALQFDPGATSSPDDDVLYLGNDLGVYRSTNFTSASPTWTRFGQGLPNVQVRDLELAPTLGILAAGTYGRGVWQILTTPAGPPSQSVNGLVFNDLNDNGVLNSGEPGLANWRVYFDANSNGQFDPIASGPTNFPSTNVPLTIPDLGSVNSTLTTSGLPGVVAKVTVTLNISHGFIGDLVVDLIAPGGQTINLFSNVGGAGTSFSDTTLDDAAATPITAGSPPFAGSYQPQQPLANLIGTRANGVWTLRVRDTVAVASGTLNSWSITLTTQEDSRLTDSSGNFQFLNVDPGTYTLRLVPQAGFRRTLPVPPADSYVVTVTSGGAAIIDRNFGVVADSVAPTVTSVVIGDGSAQRSIIRQLKVIFSEVVEFLGSPTAAFTLAKQAGGTVALAVSTAIVSGRTEATLTFLSDTTFGSLNDGRYTLTVNASQIRDLALNQMAGDSVTSFHRYYGDANGDARVDIADFGLFSTTYNLQLGQPGYLAYFDYNGDNRIDILDFGQFAIRYFVPLP